MKIVMTLLVRDESDVIGLNLDYHLSGGIDEIIVTDNNSVDGTRELLERYAKGGRVRIIDEPDDTYAQAKWVTRMARMAYTEHSADWVVHCDADEFWWPTRRDLVACLSAIPDVYGVVSVPLFDFVPFVDESRPVDQRMTFRRRRRGKVKVAHRGDPHVTVAMGNHRLDATSHEPYPGDAGVVIFHFPARSYQQFEAKVANGGAALARNTELPYESGQHWRRLYALLQDGQLKEHYRENVVFGRRRLLRGLLTGELVVDRRLQRHLAKVNRGFPGAAP
jgi:hypothetical protein